MKPRKPPLRTCVGCGMEADKRTLVRVVRTPEGYVIVDPTGKANGRGAYVCPDLACFEAAVRRKRFAHALRVNLTEDDVERLRREFERAVTGDRDDSRDGR
ncbi:MAG: YlxR family protein [Coriobacteriia bacterium]|jgi:Predicted nucleic-acid-binding protein implicated in transcription termination